MAEVYSLHLMELLMQANGPLSLEDAWKYFLIQFPHTWDNYSDFESFVYSQAILFEVQNNFIFLKGTQSVDPFAYVPSDFNPVFPLAHVPVVHPSPHIHSQDFAAETEAVKYFQKQIGRRSESWVPIKSLAGHLSQASAKIRSIVGPQSDFVYFLLRHPRIFEVQGDLVSLRDEVKMNYLFHQPPQVRQNPSRRSRPFSMFVPSGVNLPSQNTNEVSKYSNIGAYSSQSVQNLPQHFSISESQNVSQTILISLADYVAAMWFRQVIEKLGDGENSAANLDALMQEFVTAPVNVRNSVGLTRIEVTAFLEKFSQLFEIDRTTCKNRALDKASTTFVISDSTSAKSRCISLINKKGIAFCVSKSWGIIDLGQHEHVFFDRSLFKHVENLTKHFSVGETLCFNAILAPKESRARWRATRVWKETDTLAVQLSGLALASSLNSQTQDNPSSTASSEGNSDSGVQDAVIQKSTPISTGLENILNDAGFNIIRLDLESTDKLFILPEPEGLDDTDDEKDDNQNVGKVGSVEIEHDIESDQSDDNISSDLNTMSDIPSISSFLPAPAPEIGNCFVSSGTQTYFTGDILAKKVYHESVISEEGE